MLQSDWRDQTWRELSSPFDLVIVGGGITGAGIFLEARRMGLRVLLVEQNDFSWGTSSRSSKLVHGGLRYLKQMQVGLTRTSVRERERLLDEAPGLVNPLGFLLANYDGDNPGRWTFQAGLTIYDLLALHWTHKYYSAADFQMLAPHLTSGGLQGGFRYGDAQTDDARLVLRVLFDAIAAGGLALNYAKATGLLRDAAGQVTGVHLHDRVGGREQTVQARAVINATGAWADRLRAEVDAPPRIRQLRGSHLVFPAWRFPVAQAISFLHPIDRRPVFIFPWEGITLVGTTDVDHPQDIDREPTISPEEVAYLMAALDKQFAPLDLRIEDAITAFAGIRPVLNTGKEDPSKESRDHVVWLESGLLTVTGGKLTTFRQIAVDALKALQDVFPALSSLDADQPILETIPTEVLPTTELSVPLQSRLVGRYGAQATALVEAALPAELETIPGTHTLWAELRWAARAEGVVHLDDLLLRRVRLGLLLPEGGRALMPAIRAICQPELGWNDETWEQEAAAYQKLWETHYRPPLAGSIPDWRPALEMARSLRLKTPRSHGRVKRLALAAGLGSLGFSLWWLWYRRRQARA